MTVLSLGVLLLSNHKRRAISEVRQDQALSDQSVPAAPRILNELMKLSPVSVAGCDIARMNLLCAEGLRGAHGLDVEEQLRLLDGLAGHVERETMRHFYRFRQKPEQFNHSEPIYRMMMLVTVLQEDIGARYNPDRITPIGVFEENEVFFANAEDVFIHGLIGDRRMGTCASMPVFYVAVGRRLGYPLKLVPTKNHLFVRWEDSRHRFNVDATGRGFHHFDDNHYRQWPFRVSRQEEEEMLLLKSLTSSEELAVFLNLRGHCLMSMGHPDAAVAAHQQAARLAPQRKEHQLILAQALEDQQRRQQGHRILLPNGHLVAVEKAEREMMILKVLEHNQQRSAAPWGMIDLPTTQRAMLPADPNPLLKLNQPTP